MVRILFSSITILALLSCSLIGSEINVEVPKSFIGWCYIIPVNNIDDPKFVQSQKGFYKANNDGIIYIPSNKIVVEEDLKVKIYAGENEITKDVRFLSRVKKTSTDSNKIFNFIQFYIPNEDEKKYSSSNSYWREVDYKAKSRILFENLLKTGKIKYE
jgi:hypothetical protein